MTRAALLMATLVAASVLAGCAAGPEPERSAVDPRGDVYRGEVERLGEPIMVWFANDAAARARSGEVTLLRGEPTTVYLHVRAVSRAVDDTINVSASNAVLDERQVRVSLPVGGAFVQPIVVTEAGVGVAGPGADEGSSPASKVFVGDAMLHAEFPATRTSDGRPLQFGTTAVVSEPVSIAFTSPAPLYESFGGSAQLRPRVVGWSTPVEVSVNVTNVGGSVSKPLRLVLLGDRGEVRNASIAAIPAGVTRTVGLGALRAEDLAALGHEFPARFEGFGGNTATGQFFLSLQSSDQPRPVIGSRFRVEGGALEDLRHERVMLQFVRGLVTALEDADVRLVEPSTITLSVLNAADETASDVRVRVVVLPQPLVSYGVPLAIDDAVTLSIAANATRSWDYRFVPTVSGPQSVVVVTKTGSGGSLTESETRLRLDVPSPVTFDAHEAPYQTLGLGKERTFRFTINATEPVRGAKVGLAVGTEYGPVDRGAPFSKFITADDVLPTRASPAVLDVAPGVPAVVDITVEGGAPGRFVLVPYLDVGGLLHPARVEEGTLYATERLAVTATGDDPGANGGHLLVVRVGVMSAGWVWAPLVLVIVSYVGLAAVRRAVIR